MRPMPRVISFPRPDHFLKATPMERANPPFRAEHVGSLIRPAPLEEARKKADAGELPVPDHSPTHQEAPRDIARLQEALGLKLVTDGDYTRRSWHRDFMLKFRNVRMIASKLAVQFHSADGARLHSPPTMQVIGRLARPHGGIFVEDFGFLASIARAMPKI